MIGRRRLAEWIMAIPLPNTAADHGQPERMAASAVAMQHQSDFCFELMAMAIGITDHSKTIDASPEFLAALR
jgi:hypothetical protein